MMIGSTMLGSTIYALFTAFLTTTSTIPLENNPTSPVETARLLEGMQGKTSELSKIGRGGSEEIATKPTSSKREWTPEGGTSGVSRSGGKPSPKEGQTYSPPALVNFTEPMKIGASIGQTNHKVPVRSGAHSSSPSYQRGSSPSSSEFAGSMGGSGGTGSHSIGSSGGGSSDMSQENGEGSSVAPPAPQTPAPSAPPVDVPVAPIAPQSPAPSAPPVDVPVTPTAPQSPTTPFDDLVVAPDSLTSAERIEFERLKAITPLTLEERAEFERLKANALDLKTPAQAVEEETQIEPNEAPFLGSAPPPPPPPPLLDQSNPANSQLKPVKRWGKVITNAPDNKSITTPSSQVEGTTSQASLDPFLVELQNALTKKAQPRHTSQNEGNIVPKKVPFVPKKPKLSLAESIIEAGEKINTLEEKIRNLMSIEGANTEQEADLRDARTSLSKLKVERVELNESQIRAEQFKLDRARRERGKEEQAVKQGNSVSTSKAKPQFSNQEKYMATESDLGKAAPILNLLRENDRTSLLKNEFIVNKLAHFTEENVQTLTQELEKIEFLMERFPAIRKSETFRATPVDETEKNSLLSEKFSKKKRPNNLGNRSPKGVKDEEY